MERQPRTYDTQEVRNNAATSAGQLVFTRSQIIEGDWRDYRACHDLPPATFFPSDGHGVEVARAICRDCVVKEPCLEYALMNRIEHGVWGGTSERERRKLSRRYRAS